MNVRHLFGLRNLMRTAPLLLVVPLLAGCFLSKTSLYANATPLHPFRDGEMFSVADGGKTDTLVVREAGNGAYHFVRGGTGNDIENGQPHRFFPLPGAPGTVLVDEVGGQMSCPDTKTQATCPIYQYQLWRRTPAGEEVTDPDCSKLKAVAKLPGVTVSNGGKDCAFTSRASLEQAMRLAATARLKPEAILVRK